MTEIRCRELVGAYAVGALEPPEAAMLADHLLTCTRCQHVLAEAEETAAFMAAVPPEAFLDEPADPNDPLLMRTLRAIRLEAAAPPETFAPSTAAPPRRIGAAGPATPAPNAGFPGWSGQTARSHRRRPKAASARDQRRKLAFAGAAAAVVLVLGGGVMIGAKLTQSDDSTTRVGVVASQGDDVETPAPSSTAPVAGVKHLTGKDAANGVEVDVTATPGDGTTLLSVTVTGLPAGTQCTVTVTSSVGSEVDAGSLTVTEGQPYETQVAEADVMTVQVHSKQGELLVTAH